MGTEGKVLDAALAWIVEGGRLAAALEEQAAALPNVSVRRGARVVSCTATESRATVALDGVDLQVGAGEIVALVGESGSGKTTIAALDARALERRVREAGVAALGDLELISEVGRFALRIVRVGRTVAPGAALIGDAAHAVHPLAGQGVNLGFQDARLLADEVSERSALERPGDLRVLRRYARQRREDVTAMQFVTDRLDKLFAGQAPALSLLRNAGMGLVDRQGWIKTVLAGRAMR